MSTDINNNLQVSPISELELVCIEMKYEGYSFPEIHAALIQKYKTAPQLQTLRLWFSRNGKLFEFYRAYALAENKVRVKEANLAIGAHVKNAVRTLVQIMNKSKLDFARVQAAKEILARKLGDPVKIAVNVDDPAAKLLQAMGIVTDEAEPTTEEIV